MPPPWRTAFLVVCSRIPGMSGDEVCIGKRMLLLMAEGAGQAFEGTVPPPGFSSRRAPSALDERSVPSGSRLPSPEALYTSLHTIICNTVICQSVILYSFHRGKSGSRSQERTCRLEEAESMRVPGPACVKRSLPSLLSGYAPNCGEKVARAAQREAKIAAAAALVAHLCSLSGALRPVSAILSATLWTVWWTTAGFPWFNRRPQTLWSRDGHDSQRKLCPFVGLGAAGQPQARRRTPGPGGLTTKRTDTVT